MTAREADEEARTRARARRVSEPARAGEALNGVALFRELRRDDRAALCARMVECEFERGEVIVRKGEVGANFYVIAQGCVRVDARDDEGDVADTVDVGSMEDEDFSAKDGSRRVVASRREQIAPESPSSCDGEARVTPLKDS